MAKDMAESISWQAAGGSWRKAGWLVTAGQHGSAQRPAAAGESQLSPSASLAASAAWLASAWRLIQQ